MVLPAHTERGTPRKPRLPDARSMVMAAQAFYEKSQQAEIPNEQSALFRYKASRTAQLLLQNDACQPVALNLLGRIALDEGFYDKAEQLFDQALEQQPADAGLIYSKGHAALAKHEYERAQQLFERAIHIAPDETNARTSLAYIKLQSGLYAEAFDDYRKLIHQEPDNIQIKTRLAECAERIQANGYDESLAADVLFFLNLDGFQYTTLSNLISSLLIHKYQLDDANAVINMDQVASDQLLIQALTKVNFYDARIEHLITTVRRQVLIESLIQICLPNSMVDLACSLALHGTITEYVEFIDPQEVSLLEGITDLLIARTENQPWQPTDIYGFVILYAMYRSLYSLSETVDLKHYPLNEWPQASQSVLKHGLFDLAHEVELQQQIPSLGMIADEVSVKVKKQYETHPYPRWMHLSYSTPTNYGRAMEQAFSDFRAPSFFNTGTINILVAGAGTCRHAINVAKHFRNVTVLAVDISKRSLAYGKMMAEKYQVKNIDFLQADILNLSQLDRQFQIIECSGVLHHMQNPELGWKTLSKLLVPKGLMKVGLYSQAARTIIKKSRDMITRNQLSPTLDNIRLFRKTLMDSKNSGAFEGVLTSPDFYNTSGCRDLLFHSHEVQFTPQRIQSTLDKLKLDFVGFTLNQKNHTVFQQVAGVDADLKDLHNWELVEQQVPEFFAGMYQFYCQKN